jgi:hypothetical protein
VGTTTTGAAAPDVPRSGAGHAGVVDAQEIALVGVRLQRQLVNLALVCHRHHADIHAGVWSLEMIDGLPWARPPRWLDPHQELRRNTYRHHRDAAHQLALDLDPPGDPPRDDVA